MPYLNGKVVPWKHTVKIKHLMGDTEEAELPENVLKTANTIADIVEKEKCLDGFMGQHDIRGCDDIETFNYWLDELYDYADSNLIWIE